VVLPNYKIYFKNAVLDLKEKGDFKKILLFNRISSSMLSFLEKLVHCNVLGQTVNLWNEKYHDLPKRELTKFWDVFFR
jgi:hypothetical protein